MEPSSPDRVLQRFSESSVDINSVTSTESSTNPHNPLISARARRILFKSSRQDIPSIHLTRDEDRSVSPTSASNTSSNSNWLRLETLKEVPEPLSRSNSFDIDQPLTPIGGPNNKNHLFLGFSLGELRRKLSDTDVSRGGTLVDEESSESGGLNHFVNNSLHPSDYKRTLSDKSVSSLVTVIDKNERTESIDKSLQADTSNLFKPISTEEEFEEEKSVEEKSVETNLIVADSAASSPSLSAASRRSLFSSSKKDLNKAYCSDNVFSSGETIVKTTSKSDSLLPESCDKPMMDINDVRKASLNDSFRDFIKSLASDGSMNGSSHNGSPTPQMDQLSKQQHSVEIHIQAPTPAVPCGDETPANDEASEFLNDDSLKPSGNEEDCKEPESNKRQDSKDETDPKLVQDSIEKSDYKLEPFSKGDTKVDENVEDEIQSPPCKEEQPTKKGYFSAAFTSISHVFSKSNQDSTNHNKQPPCDDTAQESVEQHSEREASKQSSENSSIPLSSKTSQKNLSKGSSLFRLFNHQTLSVHSNSAFSSFASGFTNGVEVELDQVSDTSIDTNQKTTTSSNSFVKTRAQTSPGYVADSPISSDDVHCSCPSSQQLNNVKRRSKHCKKTVKVRSIESSGFDEDQREIKCPLGKNCSLGHKNGRHVYPPSSDRLDVRKESRASSNGRSSGSLSVSSSVFTHEHFDYLVQQITSLRTEVKEEFQQAAARENNMKDHFESQLDDVSSGFFLFKISQFILNKGNTLTIFSIKYAVHEYFLWKCSVKMFFIHLEIRRYTFVIYLTAFKISDFFNLHILQEDRSRLERVFLSITQGLNPPCKSNNHVEGLKLKRNEVLYHPLPKITLYPHVSFCIVCENIFP